MGGAAQITARSGSLGIGDAVDSAVSTVLKRRQQGMEQQRIGIEQGHLDLAKQAEQDRRDEAYLKILDAEQASAQSEVDPEDPESVAAFTQKVEDQQVVRQTLKARLSASQQGQSMDASCTDGH